MSRLTIALLLSLLLVGCSSTPEPQPATERETLNRSARLAFSQGQYAQAATLYQASLNQALLEDAAAAIIDARFNLALSQTYVGQYDAALAEVAQADAERVRRDLGPDPELQLLHATIHYRAGRIDQARTQLDALLADPASLPETAAKANFLAALIAADRNDSADMRRHLAALPSSDRPGGQADRLEIQARLAGLESDLDRALGLLDDAARLRSLDRDFRGMVRALATAGGLAEQAGRDELAASYFLRAGRSAAQRADPESRAWLERARDFGLRSKDTALVLEAETILAGIDGNEMP